MNLREANLRFGLLRALADAVEEELKGQRREHEAVLFEAYDTDGTRNFDIMLPDGTKVGTVTLTGVGEQYEVADELAFLQWAKAQAPDMVREVVIPPQPEQRFSEVHPASRGALLKRLQRGDDDAPFDPKTGLHPAGVVRSPQGRPRGFQTRIPADGKAQLIAAYRAGYLQTLAGDSVLAVEPADTPPWES